MTYRTRKLSTIQLCKGGVTKKSIAHDSIDFQRFSRVARNAAMLAFLSHPSTPCANGATWSCSALIGLLDHITRIGGLATYAINPAPKARTADVASPKGDIVCEQRELLW